MNSLPLELYNEILSFIIKSDWGNFVQINKYMYQKFYENYRKHIIKLKKEFIESSYPTKIIELFEGLDNMIQYPRLKWNNKYLPKREDLTKFNIPMDEVNHPFMLSVDHFKRAIIIVKSNINNITRLDILFQKDSYNNLTWGNIVGYGIMQSCNYFYVNDKLRKSLDLKNLKSYIGGSNEFIKTKTYCDPEKGLFEESFILEIDFPNK